MLILALDTTTRAGSVALLRADTVLYEHSGEPTLTHGQRLPGELMQACSAAGVSIADVQLFAVAAGLEPAWRLAGGPARLLGRPRQ